MLVGSGQRASGLCWTQGDDPGSHDEYIKAERWFPCQQPPADQTRPATNTWLTRQWDGCFGRKSENKAVKVSAIGKRLDLKKILFLMDKRVLCPIINSQSTQGTRIVRSRFCADFPTGAFIICALPYSMYVLGGRAPDYHIVQNHVHQ